LLLKSNAAPDAEPRCLARVYRLLMWTSEFVTGGADDVPRQPVSVLLVIIVFLHALSGAFF